MVSDLSESGVNAEGAGNSKFEIWLPEPATRVVPDKRFSLRETWSDFKGEIGEELH